MRIIQRICLFSLTLGLLACGREKTASSNNTEARRADENTLLKPYTEFSWALDRINQRNLPLDNNRDHALTGKGVNIYVIDGLPMEAHKEFLDPKTGLQRLINVFSSIMNDPAWREAVHEHGTHVAALAGGQNVGVASGANLFGIDTLVSGEVDAYIDALRWVAQNHKKPAVLNLSSSLKNKDPEKMRLIEEAVYEVLNAGVILVSSAGNSSEDACLDTLPAKIPGVITVGSINANDERAASSSYGACVDIFAPGEIIPSAVSFDYGTFAPGTSLGLMSGTSMATPLVTGAVALLLEKNPGMSAADISKELVARASKNRIKGLPEGTPNRILFVGSEANEANPPKPAPLHCRNKCEIEKEFSLLANQSSLKLLGDEGIVFDSIPFAETTVLNRTLYTSRLTEIWIEVEGEDRTVFVTLELFDDDNNQWIALGRELDANEIPLRAGANFISAGAGRYRLSVRSESKAPAILKLRIGKSAEVEKHYIGG